MIVIGIIRHITSFLSPKIEDDFTGGIPRVIQDIVLDTHHVPGQGQNIGSVRVRIRELSYRCVLRREFPLKPMPSKIRPPCGVGRRHISPQRPFDAEAEIGIMPILVKGLAESPNRAVSDVLPKWARVVMCVFHGANPCHGGIQGLRHRIPALHHPPGPCTT